MLGRAQWLPHAFPAISAQFVCNYPITFLAFCWIANRLTCTDRRRAAQPLFYKGNCTALKHFLWLLARGLFVYMVRCCFNSIKLISIIDLSLRAHTYTNIYGARTEDRDMHFEMCVFLENKDFSIHHPSVMGAITINMNGRRTRKY